MIIKRLLHNPIITPSLHFSIGNNINGPSLIRVPDWVSEPLGKYYLYFAHHQGKKIRLAYADHILGPWSLYKPGVLNYEDAFASSHIASPDIHIIPETKEIRMYYHSCCLPTRPTQVTHVAHSRNGLHFTAQPEILGSSYWRVFKWQGFWYTLEMPGQFRRSSNGLTDFEVGPKLFTPNMRHAAVLLREDILYVFYSNAQDCPECILWTKIHLHADWQAWKPCATQILLKPETPYEGADCPLVPSRRGAIHQRVNQLRDPCIFMEDGKTFLLYTIAGENGIAIAELFIP